MCPQLALQATLKAHPRQIVNAHLLQVPSADLEQVILRELEKNPALEFCGQGLPARGEHNRVRQNHGERDSLPMGSEGNPEDLMETVAYCPSAWEQLCVQVSLLADGSDRTVALCLLHYLDERGYLPRSPEDLAADMAVPLEHVARALRLLHQIEPPGIGAPDLRECLLLQCRHWTAMGVDCALPHLLISQGWDELVARRWSVLMKKLGICRPALDEALSFISQRLYPHPLPLIDSSPTGDSCSYHADVIITCGTAGDYVLEFPGADAFELRISSTFTLALREETAALSTREQEWIRSHVNQANLFLAALQQRWITLRRIAEYLVDYQHAFLAEGPQHLRSLTRRDVAEALGLHESTVGRAVSDKVVQLPNGRFRPLTIFFDSALPAREAIRNLLAQSDRALSDQEIAEQLQAAGWQLARRTVAKYRQQMSLSSSHRRNGH